MRRDRSLTIHAIASVEVERIDVALRESIARHGESIPARTGFRVALHTACGSVGRGEAWPLVAAGTETPAQTELALAAGRKVLQQQRLSLEEMLDRVSAELAEAPAARAALDIAAHDLAARARGIPVAALLAPKARPGVDVNAMLGAGTIADTIARSRAACAAGYRALKLKVGANDPADDLARVAAVRAAVGPDVSLRVDANGAWTAESALAVLRGLAAHDVAFVEQPVAAHDLDALAHVHARSPVAVAADESLAVCAGRERLLRGEIASIAVIKLMVQGGLRPAAKLCVDAARRGIRAVVTTTIDGPAATAAALHLAATHGCASLAHGLDAATSVDLPFPRALVPTGGRLCLASAPGLGDLA